MCLDMAHSFTGDVENLADLVERLRLLAADSETKFEHTAFAV